MVNATAIALIVASNAHAGQVDRQGAPYINHPIAVSEKVAHLGPIAQAIALLHDTFEDCNLNEVSLNTAGLPPAVGEGVRALSRKPGETYVQFIERIAACAGTEREYLVHIKLADIEHNGFTLGRPCPPNLQARYTKARETLRLSLHHP